MNSDRRLPVQGHIDIWREILDYYHYDVEDDTEERVREVRQDILNVALVSRSLTDMALNALWKVMTTLEPVVHVINSSIHSTQDKVITYVDAGNGRSKVLRWVSNEMCKMCSDSVH